MILCEFRWANSASVRCIQGTIIFISMDEFGDVRVTDACVIGSAVSLAS